MISPRWPSTPLAKYPHLVGSDIEIWDQWIRLYGHNFTGMDYDVHVGQGLEPDPDSPYPNQVMWTHITQKRIDVLAYRPTSTWLIEVKDRPTVAAIGQVISYSILYQADFTPSLPIIPCLIAGIIEPDIEALCRALDIRFYDLSDDHHWLSDPRGSPFTAA